MTKRNETLINHDDVNAKCKKVINLFNEMMISETNEKKNDNVKFKQKKKKIISFEIVTTTNEKEIIMKIKASIENNDSYMFENFDMKNSIERISTKHYFDDIMLFSNFFEISTFDVEIFLK